MGWRDTGTERREVPVVTADSALKVRALPGEFGAAEVEGLRVDEHAHNTAARDLLQQALWDHAVVCVRLPGPLPEAELRDLASMIGAVKDPVGRTRDGGTLRYSEERQVIDAGFVLTDELRERLGALSFGGLDSQRPGLFETFHTDDTYTERPALATVLHARELPAGPGGNTQFLDMRAAFQLLAPEVQRRLISLRAVHTYNNRGAFPPRVSAEGEFEQLVDVAHPIVRAHPRTDRPALYFDLDRATHIDGMSEREGRGLLQSLQDHAEQQAPRYAHGWRPHDVLIWDNAAVQHKAAGDFPVGEPRNFWRYMVEGPEPQAYAPEE
jgi:alpha-ketoglutarate-dependent taurine dioxygenase